MTRPTFIAFSYDLGRGAQPDIPKIVLRALLFSTGKRGVIVENMFATLHHLETQHSFDYWGYKIDSNSDLVRGGGLFVGERGTAGYHHFNPLRDPAFRFKAGLYRLDLFASVLHARHATKAFRKLCSIELTVTTEGATALANPGTRQAYEFARDARAETYHGSVR
jgi:hypothetical protein